MSRVNFDTLLEAGCHFGHLKRKWNPAMAPYIFMERNGIHIIDLNKTVAKVDEAAEALKQIAKSGKKILFVATKKQAKQVVAEKAASVSMPYVIERWPGGMLTNFPTIRKAVKKMATIDKLTNDGTYANLSKREVLQISRQRAKLEKNLGSIADLTRLPSALFVIDVLKENIAVREATVWVSLCSLSSIRTLIPTTWIMSSRLMTMPPSLSKSSSMLAAAQWLKVWKKERLKRWIWKLPVRTHRSLLRRNLPRLVWIRQKKTLSTLQRLPLSWVRTKKLNSYALL